MGRGVKLVLVTNVILIFALGDVACAGPQRDAVCGGGCGGGCGPCGPPPLSPAQIAAFQLNEQGIAAFTSGDYAKAAKLFTDALYDDPSDATIAGNLKKARDALRLQDLYSEGRAAFYAGNYADAVSHFEQAQSLFPDLLNKSKWLQYARDALQFQEARALNDRGNAAYKAEDYAAAEHYYEQALAQVPAGRSDTTIRKNLQDARDHLNADAEKNVQSAADQQTLGDLAKTLSAAKAPPADADKNSNTGHEPEDKSLALLPSSGKDLFGTTAADPSSPSAPFHVTMRLERTTRHGTDRSASHQGKAAAGSSISGVRAHSEEDAARLAEKTFDRSGSHSDESVAVDVSVPTPSSEAAYPPAVSSALAADKDYRALMAQRAKAASDESAAEQRIHDLKERQKTDTDSGRRQEDQIKISDATVQLTAAKSAVAALDSRKDQIVQRVVYKVLILPAAAPTPRAAASSTDSAGRSSSEGKSK